MANNFIFTMFKFHLQSVKFCYTVVFDFLLCTQEIDCYLCTGYIRPLYLIVNEVSMLSELSAVQQRT